MKFVFIEHTIRQMAYAGLPSEPIGTPRIWRTHLPKVEKMAFVMSKRQIFVNMFEG